MVSTIKNVCLVGANGTVGSAILAQLTEAGTFAISVLRRSTSKSTPPSSNSVTSILTVSPSFEIDELVTVLDGQDAVIAAFPVCDVAQHLRLADAAALAGVTRFIPADFGSCDPSSTLAQECADIYRHKMCVRRRCNELSAIHASFSWTSFICGHLFDKDLLEGYIRFHLSTYEAEIFDGGNKKISSSTLVCIGRAVVRLLRDHLDETRDRALYIQSFNPTQLEVLASLEQITGQKWRTRHASTDAYLHSQRQEFLDGNHAVVDNIIFVLGIRDADWTVRDDFANDLLELEREDLDTVIATVVAQHSNLMTQKLIKE